jgi:hypothetical protein
MVGRSLAGGEDHLAALVGGLAEEGPHPLSPVLLSSIPVGIDDRWAAV